ncbi:hypothetical protein IPJ72_02135 [Candidatus Peregrinibacteria bacterium]|nr:MAG: hypothetical protein IPJ72_02135 [Candidatus Peregrinibacteria bacterium]
MNLSIFIAQIFALLMLGTGIAAIRGSIQFNKMIDEFVKSPALTFVTGFFTLLIGMIVIHVHNVWVKDWTVLITLLGWASAVKGFLFIAYPESLKSFKGMYKNTKRWGGVLVIISLLLTYLAFFTA